MRPKDVLIEEWFWTQTKPNGDCLDWTLETNNQGYGHFTWDGENWRTHVFSWLVTNGSTNGLQVLHRCDRPMCVNPDHLWLGTISDNMRDKVEKGLQARGFALPHTKLSDDDVRELRLLWATGTLSQQEIASQFRITAPYVSLIVNMKRRR
jgi:hypothetical protein